MMTEFDKQLIEKANTKIPRYDYRDVDVLINIADTDEAREHLTRIKWNLFDLVKETI